MAAVAAEHVKAQGAIINFPYSSHVYTHKWYAFDGRFKLTNSNSFCESFGFKAAADGAVGDSNSRLDTVRTPLV